MAIYTTRPLRVEAWFWAGPEAKGVPGVEGIGAPGGPATWYLKTPEGPRVIEPGSYVVKVGDGAYVSVPKAEFEARHVLISERHDDSYPGAPKGKAKTFDASEVKP